MLNTDHLNPDSESAAQRLEIDPDYRVLRAVPKPYSSMPGNGAPPDGRCIAIVDLETSGLDPDNDAIIELALMLVFVNEEGEVLGHFGPLSWLQDPGTPLEPEIVMLTGLTNQHLRNCQIVDRAVEGLLQRADLFVAHNCAFEIAWLERRYPSIKDKPWACSMRDLPWLKLCLDGRAQTALLNQHGWFANAHRAGDDVWSLFWLLQQSRTGWLKGDRLTHLQRLLAAADRTTSLVEARGAPFDKKDRLRARGYRWNAGQRVWAKELEQDAVEHEQAWFYRSGLPFPVVRAITASERHR